MRKLLSVIAIICLFATTVFATPATDMLQMRRDTFGPPIGGLQSRYYDLIESEISAVITTANTANSTANTALTDATTTPTFRSGMFGSSNAVVDNAVANFFPANGAGAPVASTLEGDVSTLAPWIATLKNLKCVLTSGAGVVTVAGGTNYVIALRKNIASSTLTCTIATAASSCTDITHTVTTAVGDQLDFIVTPTGTPTALVVKCSMEVDI